MPLFKKLIIIFGVVVLILFIALVIAAWYLGTFASVNLKNENRGPYNVVLLSQMNSYREITHLIEKVDIMLDKKDIKHTQAIVIFYDDPIKVALQRTSIKAGYIVLDSVKVDSPLVYQTIDKRSVAVASIKAHPAIAPFKTFPALQEWMQKNEFRRSGNEPSLELYYSNGLVEIEIPIMIN